MRISLIIVTYNWSSALKICLHSAMQQTLLPDEIIIADDGSIEETMKDIDSFCSISPIPIFHLWQPNQGFRINSIRNKALKKAKHDYIIQINGDLVLNKNFIKDHTTFAKPNRIIFGKSQYIPKKETKELLKTLNYKQLKHTPNKILIQLYKSLFYNTKDIYKANGHNMSYWKKDALDINGYDEDLTGKGFNETEFAARLINNGLKGYYLKYHAICFHLWHYSVYEIENYLRNKQILKSTIKGKKIKCENGLINMHSNARIKAENKLVGAEIN